MSAPRQDFEEVEFGSGDVILRGRFYGGSQQPRGPAVIQAPGFTTTTSGMVADRYAQAFAAAGFGVLLFDHPGFGRSGGEPRLEIEPWQQTRAYLAAIAYMRSRTDVDAERIALWGASSSAARAMVAASVDEHVACLVLQVPAFGDSISEGGPATTAFPRIRETLLRADLDDYERSVTGPMAVVSPDQSVMPSLLRPITAYRWFIHFGALYGTGWENRASFVTLNVPQPLDPQLCAPSVSVPTLAVLAEHDEMHGANADVARHVLGTMPAPVEIVNVGGGHFGVLYPGTPDFDRSLDAQREFLVRQLG